VPKADPIISIVVVFFAAVFFGCAAAPPRPVEFSLSRLEEADAIILKIWSDFLPPFEAWPARLQLSSSGEKTREYLQCLTVSSLCYFPRSLPGLEKALSEAGFLLLNSNISREEMGSTCYLRLEAAPGLAYRFEFHQAIKGRLALIIDDVGYTLANKELLLNLDYPITLAILPRLSRSLAWNQLARRHGYEIFLHFPLEAINPDTDIGPGGLLRSAPAAEISQVLDLNLKSVPDAVGVNNHMGSVFTAHTEAMRTFLEELRRRDLVFVDSLTTPATATPSVARRVGIPFAVRDIFLDHENREEVIVQQFQRLRAQALREGRAVAIGHYRRMTLEILARLFPLLAEDGLQVVPASELVR